MQFQMRQVKHQGRVESETLHTLADEEEDDEDFHQLDN